MAEPLEFPESNKVWQPPTNMPNCVPLHTVTALDTNGLPHVVSLWQLSPDELEALQKNGGRIWLDVTADVPPPVWLGTEKPFTFTDPGGDGAANGDGN